MYNAAVMAHMVSSGQQAALFGTTTPISPVQYTWPTPTVDELFESQRWIYIRKSKAHGKKVGETAGIILVDVNGVERRLTMEELAVAAGWEW